MSSDILKLLLAAGAGYFTARALYKRKLKNYNAEYSPATSETFIVRAEAIPVYDSEGVVMGNIFSHIRAKNF